MRRTRMEGRSPPGGEGSVANASFPTCSAPARGAIGAMSNGHTMGIGTAMIGVAAVATPTSSWQGL